MSLDVDSNGASYVHHALHADTNQFALDMLDSSSEDEAILSSQLDGPGCSGSKRPPEYGTQQVRPAIVKRPS